MVVNIRYSNNGRFSFKEIYLIFSTNNIFGSNNKELTNIKVGNTTFGHSSFVDLIPIKKVVWVTLASAFAGFGLAIAGSITQGLTQNPIADPTTFGSVDASVFGALFMYVFLGSHVNKDIFQYIFLSFAFLGGSFSVLLILFLINNNAQKNNYLKITLAGLAIGIMFKTLSFLLRSNNAGASSASLNFALGGAENIYPLYPSQFSILYIAIFVIAIAFLSSIFLAKNLTVMELGEDKAKTLGVNVRVTKGISLILIFITIPIAVALVGNVAFIGLFAPHIIRMVFRTRNYLLVIPLSALLGAIVLSIG